MIQTDPQASALIVDLDGTLLDTHGAHFLAWREALQEWGFEMSSEYFAELWGKTTEHILRRIREDHGVDIDLARFAIAKDQAYVRHIPRIHPFPAVVAAVEAARDRIPVAVATNEGFGVANIVLRGTGLAPLFTVLVTADDVEKPKPEPDIFLFAAERLGVAPEACQVLEDSPVGLQAARNAGMIVTDVRPYL